MVPERRGSTRWKKRKISSLAFMMDGRKVDNSNVQNRVAVPILMPPGIGIGLVALPMFRVTLKR